MFWQNALANFFGSLCAAALVWLFVTTIYELPRSKKDKRELLAVSYGLIRRELDSALDYCVALLHSRPDEISAVTPVTQAWETLHSTESFKYFPPRLTERLVMCYSLLFRLKQHVENAQFLFMTQPTSPSADPARLRVRSQSDQFARQVARESQEIVKGLQILIEKEVSKFDKERRQIFEDSYSTKY